MLKDIIIGVLLLASAGLGFLYEDARSTIGELENDRLGLHTQIHRSDSTILSTEVERDNAYHLLDSTIYDYNRKLANSNWKAKSIEAKYNDLLGNLTGVSNDSIARYIVDNFAGSEYKLQKLNDTLFIAFEDTTARDIVRQHLECEKQGEELEMAKVDLAIKDTLIKLQAKKIAVSDTAYTGLKSEYVDLTRLLEDCELRILELQGELDRQKRWKITSFATNGGLFLLLLMVL